MGKEPNQPTSIPTVEQTPVPPDMAHYYHNYQSPGRGKSWGPTNKHPPNHPYARPTRSTGTATLADGQEPLPRATKSSPWLPPGSDTTLSTATPPQLRSLPDVSLESLSGLDAFQPRHHKDFPILEGDAPSYSSSSHPSDYQEASAIDPDYVPNPDSDTDLEDL